ncbi:MAG TPA: molybdate ABC transporter permease subunit [Terriglobales bacterium]|nr:molybdate ABC transporter permease subunit [Terriglobales bacterium]
MNWVAILLTLKLATWVAVILLIIGIPLAYWIAFTRFRAKFLVEAIVAMPLVLPPTVLGFYVLIAIGSRSPLGAWFERIFGHSFAFSFEGLLVASVLYSLPFAVQPFAASFAAVDRRLVAASHLLGASGWRTFVRVIAPLSLPGLVTGLVLSFAHTVGEFGVVLMVGGNIPGVTRTISVDIYDRVQELDYAGANETALALLAFSFFVLCAVYATNRTLWKVWLSR